MNALRTKRILRPIGFHNEYKLENDAKRRRNDVSVIVFQRQLHELNVSMHPLLSTYFTVSVTEITEYGTSAM
jgi:hypothetical protein